MWYARAIIQKGSDREWALAFRSDHGAGMCKIDLIMHIIILALLSVCIICTRYPLKTWLFGAFLSRSGQQIPTFLQQDEVCWSGDVSPIIDNKTNCPEGFLAALTMSLCKCNKRVIHRHIFRPVKWKYDDEKQQKNNGQKATTCTEINFLFDIRQLKAEAPC